MSHVPEEQINILISEIDKGLVELYRAAKSKGKYKYFDFKRRISRLLSLYVDSGYRRKYILNYYYIFQDLHSKVGADIITYKGVNKEENKITWEVTQLRPNGFNKKSLKQLEIDESTKILLNEGYYYEGMDSVTDPIKKVRYLLEGCDIEKSTSDDEVDDMLFFNEFSNDRAGIENLYRVSGFNEIPFWGSSRSVRFKSYVEELILNTSKEKGNTEPHKLEDLFYNPKHAEECLNILKELPKPVLDSSNNYIGKNKGIFPLWIEVLQQHKPGLIKPFHELIYKDVLNATISGLKLSKDASEFRKHYKMLEKSGTKLDMIAVLSEYSQSGKLGK
jgi:hypothetical protein